VANSAGVLNLQGGCALSGEKLLSVEGCVWGLGHLCRQHRVPFSADLLRQQFAPPFNLPRLLHAAEALGFKCGWRSVAAQDFAEPGLPLLALLRPAQVVNAGQAPSPSAPVQENAAGEPAHSLALVLRRSPTQVTYLREREQSPFTESHAEFESRYTGQSLFATPVPGKAQDPDASPKFTGASGAGQDAFGFSWFIPELLKHKAVWGDVLLASFAIQLLALGTPLLTQVVIDKVIVHHSLSTLTVIGIALAVFIVFTAGLSWVRQYLVLHTGNRIDAVLGSQVFEHLFRLPPRYFEHRGTGVLVARVHGVETIREFLSSACVTLLLDIPFLFIFLAIMFWYSVPLTLVSVAVLGAIVVLSMVITPFLRARINRQFLLGARNQAFLTEYVSGLETVKSLQMEPQLNQRYGQYLASYLQAGFATRNLANGYNQAAHALEQSMTLAILCLGAWQVMNSNEFSIGMLVAFQMFASRLAQPMLHLVGLWQQFQQADIAVKRLGDIMDVPPEPYSLTPARETRAEARIEIQNLGFRYAENLPYLFQGLSISIPSGQCLALMGPSGSGKSTLAKLLQGFYLPSEGAILLSGLDIRHLAANELRGAFGVVPQETRLFAGSILENLALANPHASFEQVMTACKLAEIHDTIEQLAQGYQTQIGEHGAGLSGGQKQRIAIARALLKRPKVLIFDEATSSLDNTTAEQFAITVNKLKGKVSMIFIAHQLPWGLLVDRVVRLGGSSENGVGFSIIGDDGSGVNG
jgi:subfamily B ATP-binding cassette protein HlyB/CyaB